MMPSDLSLHHLKTMTLFHRWLNFKLTEAIPTVVDLSALMRDSMAYQLQPAHTIKNLSMETFQLSVKTLLGITTPTINLSFPLYITTNRLKRTRHVTLTLVPHPLT
jgi:hypothetical protein